MTKISIKFISAAAILAALGAVFVTTPASAGLGIACPNPTVQTFQHWGDVSFYSFLPDGGFETGGAGWKLAGGATVVSGNETFAVHGVRDSHSLVLPSGSSGTTPPMCIGLLSSHMRFFVRNSGNTSSRLRIQVIYNGGLGAVLGILDVGSVAAGSSWEPSPSVLMLGGLLPLLTQSVQFRFLPADSTGKWQIDDVYVDPLMHG
jgi:hypothetical protein